MDFHHKGEQIDCCLMQVSSVTGISWREQVVLW